MAAEEELEGRGSEGTLGSGRADRGLPIPDQQ